MSAALAALAQELREDDALLAHALVEPTSTHAPYGAIAAEGPRAAADPAGYARLVEAVREGYELHYGAGRLIAVESDPDLALLAGDRAYALGLERLAALGDLAGVAELADVIALSAQAHAEARPSMAQAAWEEAAHAVGHGPRPEHAAAKAAWRRGATPKEP